MEAMAAVDSVLEELGAGDRPRLVALNKIDLLDVDERRDLLVGEAKAVAISAESGEGIDALRERIESEFADTLRPVELLVPYSAGGQLSELHEIAGDLEREDTPEGVLVRARVPAGMVHRFAEFDANGAGRADGSDSDAA